MKSFVVLSLGAVALSAFILPPRLINSALASEWMPEEVTCPLDQVSFNADVLASRYSLISDYRLDGRPVGAGSGPWPLQVCPHNGFVFFDSHTWNASQLIKLRGFVSSPVYQEAMTEEEAYYRLARIYEFLAEPPERIAQAYLYASWETPYDDPFLHTRRFFLEPYEPTDLIAAEAHYRWYVDQALTHYQAALKDGYLSAEKSLDIKFKCMELSRLVGRFGQAEKYLKELQRTQKGRPTEFNELLKYEARLIREQDAGQHDVKEATKANRSPLAYSPGQSR